MSARLPERARARGSATRAEASLFAALGDETRLSLVAQLARGQPLSIAALAADSPLTRQAVTKHLSVLQAAGLVTGTRRGRERLFGLDPHRLRDARAALDTIANQWDDALGRLKAFVEP